MDNKSAHRLTLLLNEFNGGGPDGFRRLVEAVYDDLRGIAARRLADRFNGPLPRLTSSPTAIAHDAIMALREQRAALRNTEHFFAIAALLVDRQINDYLKRRRALKRGEGRRGVSLADVTDGTLRDEGGGADLDLPRVADCLTKLHAEYPRKAEVVSLHVLCGYSLPRVASMINLSLAQTERDWSFARGWLRKELGQREGEG